MSRKTIAEYKAHAREKTAAAFRKQGIAYREVLRDKVDARCKDIRIGRGRYADLRVSDIPGIASSQVIALLEIMAEEIFILRKEVSKLKGQEL